MLCSDDAQRNVAWCLPLVQGSNLFSIVQITYKGFRFTQTLAGLQLKAMQILHCKDAAILNSPCITEHPLQHIREQPC